MAKVSFVGFQEKVEIPEGFQLLEIEESLETMKDKDFLYSLMSDPRYISQWLDEVVSFDSRPGGKMVFADGNNATCTSFVLGKEVSLISDEFGNFNAKVIKGKAANSLQLKFTILTDDSDLKTTEIMVLLERLKSLL
ncbi:hypothetical protein MCEMRE196_01365 [Candidatus Nanopelagicaceae bacterium]